MLLKEKYLEFFKTIYQKRSLILSLAAREVRTQYVGSTLGVVWTFIPPLVLITVFWVVFSLGFKAIPRGNVPFVVWLTAGMTSWFVFADMLSGSTSSIISNVGLIKKTIFPAQILPIVKIISSLVTHAVFLIILVFLLVFQAMPLSFYYFQFLYYLFCLLVLALGLGWLFASLNVFVRDVAQAVGLILQVGFWATPIFWDIKMMPEKIQFFLKLNPMYYIVQGYRESFIYFIPFWKHPCQTIYFWGITFVLFFLGCFVFKKLQPQFADIL